MTSPKDRDPSPIEDDLASDDSRKWADATFIDGLLERLYTPPQSLEQSLDPAIDRAMERIAALDRPARQSWLRALMARRSMLSAIAAGLLIAAVTWFNLGGGGETADAALGRSLSAALANTDREYQVSYKGSYREVDARLFVRGAANFMVEMDGPAGPVRLGSDGDEVWFVPAVRLAPVLVSKEGSDVIGWLQQQNLGLPYLQITTVLEKIRDHYSLDFDDASKDEALITVVGRRVSDESHLPDSVWLEADGESGVVERLRLQWDNAVGPREMNFELVDEPTLELDWYGHQSHHSENRRVRRF